MDKTPAVQPPPIQVVELSALTATLVVPNPCPGYTLTFPEGQTAWSLYPFTVHSAEKIPWSIASSGENLVLHSLDPPCSQVSQSSNTGNPQPCTSCKMLHDHDIIMGIQHCALDGAKERTPWAYLSSAQMFSSLECKNEVINNLKLKSLSVSCMLGVRNCHIEGWKRLSIAISTENIPQIKSLMAAAQRAGVNIFSMLKHIKHAALHTYSSKGYGEADYKLSYLIYKISGRAAANIAQKALGIHSIYMSKEHLNTMPLVPSLKFPMTEELIANVLMCFGNSNSNRVSTMAPAFH